MRIQKAFHFAKNIYIYYSAKLPTMSHSMGQLGDQLDKYNIVLRVFISLLMLLFSDNTGCKVDLQVSQPNCKLTILLVVNFLQVNHNLFSVT